MQQIGINIHFPKEEYEQLKEVAFAQQKSVSAFIRHATQESKEKYLASKESRTSLLKRIQKAAVHSDVATTRLIHDG